MGKFKVSDVVKVSDHDSEYFGLIGTIEEESETYETKQPLYWVRFKEGFSRYDVSPCRPFITSEIEYGERTIDTKLYLGGESDASYIEVRVHISREGLLVTFMDSEGFDKAYVDVELRRGGFYVSTEDENGRTTGRILVHDAVALQGRQGD